jgi:hypothetical protein
LEDLLVHDLCGAYIVTNANGDSPGSEGAKRLLPDDGPFKYVEVSGSFGGFRELARGSESGFSVLRSGPADAPWTLTTSVGLAKPVDISPKRDVVPIDDSHDWLAVGDSVLYRFTPSGETLASVEYHQTAPAPPNLLGYTTIDDLESLRNTDCGLFDVGIGRFPATSGKSPSAAVAVYVDVDATEYRTQVLDIDIDAFTLDRIVLDDGSMLVGVLGSRDHDPTFAVFRLVPCGDPEILASVHTEISTRRAPAPGFGEPLPPDKTQTRLLGLRSANLVRFVTYDGYDAHVYEMSTEDLSKITERLFHVHDDRLDLAFP